MMSLLPQTVMMQVLMNYMEYVAFQIDYFITMFLNVIYVMYILEVKSAILIREILTGLSFHWVYKTSNEYQLYLFCNVYVCSYRCLFYQSVWWNMCQCNYIMKYSDVIRWFAFRWAKPFNLRCCNCRLVQERINDFEWVLFIGAASLGDPDKGAAGNDVGVNEMTYDAILHAKWKFVHHEIK